MLQWTFALAMWGAFASIQDPALARQRMSDGDRLMGQKKRGEAVEAYEAAEAAAPQSAEANFKLGNAYASVGDYLHAVECWSKAKKLSADPSVQKNAEANIDRAAKKLGTTRLRDLVRPMDRAVAKMAYEDGVARLLREDFDGAAAQLTLAIEQDATVAEFYVARGGAFIALRKYPLALQDYLEALKLKPALAAARFGLAESYRVMGRTSLARENYQLFLESSDTRPELREEVRAKLRALAPSQS